MTLTTHIIDQCPHCSTKYVQTVEQFQSYDGKEYWRILRCQNGPCSRFVLQRLDIGGNLSGTFPSGSYELDKDIGISETIRDEYKEAGHCLDAGCYKASMVMSRRVLQRCLKEQGRSEYKLVDAINQAIKIGLLRKAFHDLAEEIREYGNLGAHPDDEQLENANKENAESILNFLRLIIHDFYEVPASALKLRQQRDKK